MTPSKWHRCALFTSIALLVVPSVLGRLNVIRDDMHASIDDTENRKGQQDVCGDPIPNRDNPRQILEYLSNTEDNKKTSEYVEKHPFIVDVENGKLDRTRMTSFIVNYARFLSCFSRSLGSALNAFGSDWPTMERRELVRNLLDFYTARLERIQPLAQAFGIDMKEALMRFEPDQNAMILSSHISDIIAHASDISELSAPVEVRLGIEAGLHRRIKAALQTNAAYKPWNLDANALAFFDWDKYIDVDDVKRMNDAIIARAVDEGVIVCMLRRRLAQMNNGEVHFWDAANHIPSAAA